MINSIKFVVVILCFLPFGALAQGRFANTLEYDSLKGPARAAIKDIGWIAGTWRGHAMDGQVEEIWSKPMGGSMMGSFKYVEEGKVIFYELETISEVDGSLLLTLKHFNADLTGWEEKEKTVNFRLVKIDKNIAYFDGLTFEKVGDSQMNVYVVFEAHGKPTEAKFSYSREN